MKRLLACCLIVFWVGCGDESSSESRQSDNAPGEMQIVQQTGSKTTDTPDVALAQSLNQLMAQANEFEAQEEFSQAASVWLQILRRLNIEFGEKSWQQANAKLAYETSLLQAEFNTGQLEDLRRIGDLQNQMQAALKQDEVVIAAKLAEQSVQHSERLFGPDSPVTAKQRFQYAKLLKKLGRDNDAVFQFEKSAAVMSSSFARLHPELCLIHDSLGEVYLGASNFGGAITHLKTATKMASDIWGDESVQYAKRANQLGVAYQRSGDRETALQVFRAAEVIRRLKLGANDPQVAHSLLNTGTVLLDLKQYDEACSQLTKACEIFAGNEQLLPLLELASQKLAIGYMLASKPELAEPVLAGMLARAKQRLPESDSEIADLQYRYAIALGRQGKYDLAEPELLKAIATQEATYGPMHSKTSESYRAYALLLVRTKRQALADKVMSRIRIAQKPDDNSFMPRIP